MAGLPSGTVTFLFTDIEGSTRLWEGSPAAMRAALARHDEIVRGGVERHGGHVFSTGGDGVAAAFARAGDAVTAAVEVQADLAAEQWPEDAQLRVRMALNTGEVEERGGDYFGRAVNRAARLMAAGCGGQVLCSQATAALLDAEVLVIDLGEHLLRDLDRPVRVFQVGEGVFPAVRALEGRTGEWSASAAAAPATEFYGRTVELRLIEARLERCRVVTLVGVGGTGKTRLAWEVVDKLGGRFAHGIAWADLAHVGADDLVVRSVAQAVGVFDASVDRDGDTAIERRLLGLLADKKLLLVIDNCEHVIVPVARLCQRIAETCTAVRILATSREPLGLAGEHRVVVGPLDVIAARDLFCARAEAVGAEIDMPRDGPVVDAICDRLDRVALAVELAASRARMMSLRDIEQRLSNALGLLVSAERSADPRQATMLAALEWSYDLLDEHEQTLFTRLGVFVGGWDLDAVQEVCSEQIDQHDVIEVMAQLVDKSLVTVDRAASRYRLLEPVRQYAWQRLIASDEGSTLVAVHRRHFRRKAFEINAGILGSGLGAEDRAELANFRAAINRALDVGDGRAALGVFVNLGWYWVTTGSWREAIEWGQHALALAAGSDARLEMIGHAQVAGFLSYSGHPRQAVPHADHATELLPEAPDDYGARYLLSTAMECLGNSPIDVLNQAEDNALSAGDRAFAAYIAGAHARYYMLMWRGDEALAPLARARGYVEAHATVFSEELDVKQLALDLLLGRPSDAALLGRLEKGPVGRSALGLVSDDRSLALALEGKPDAATAAIARETRAAARGGWMQRVVLHLHYAAVARARLGEADQAVALAQAAERAREELGFEPLPIMAHVGANHLKAAIATLGPSAATRARVSGNNLDISAAIELACSPTSASTSNT